MSKQIDATDPEEIQAERIAFLERCLMDAYNYAAIARSKLSELRRIMDAAGFDETTRGSMYLSDACISINTAIARIKGE